MGFACYYRGGGGQTGERRPDARQPPGLSQGPLPALSSSAAPFLCPRYRLSYPARGCANYIGDRESAPRSTIEIACRLSAWPAQPFPSSRPLSPAAISSFLRALFHRRRQTIQASRRRPRRDDNNKVVGKAIVRMAIQAPRLPRVRGRATTIVRPQNEHDDNTKTRTTMTTRTARPPLPSPRKTLWFCGNLSSLPAVALFLQRSFIPGFSSLFTISHYAPLGYAHKCARVKARIWWTEGAWTSYRRRQTAFLFIMSFYGVLRSLSLSLSSSPTYSHVKVFFSPLHLDLCLPQRDRKTSAFRVRGNFSFQRFSPTRHKTRLSHRLRFNSVNLVNFATKDTFESIHFPLSSDCRCAQF